MITRTRSGKWSLHWWYRLSVPSEDTTSFLQSEARRRGRLVSLVLLVLLVASFLAIPVFLYDGEEDLLIAMCTIILFTAIALVLNRMGKITSAGALVTALLCGAIMFDLVTTPLLRSRDLPEFDLLVLAELAAVSLVSARSVFLLAGINSTFIGLLLALHPLSPDLEQVIVQDSLYAVIFRSVTLQVIVAVVLYLWVRTAQRAILRADRAEVDGAAQHALLEQSKVFVREKRLLDENIGRMMNVLVHSGSDPSARIVFSQADPLWQCMHMLNMLLGRVQQTRAMNNTLQVSQENIDELVMELQRRRAQHERAQLPCRNPLLDPLVREINVLLADKMFVPTLSCPLTSQEHPPTTLQRGPHHAVVKKTVLCHEV